MKTQGHVTNSLDSLEFKAFGMGFIARGPRAIVAGSVLVALGFVVLAFAQSAVAQLAALARSFV